MTATKLPASGHVVYELTPGLLLVFKPRGHRETAHAHAYGQRLRVLRGRLRVEMGSDSVTLEPACDVLLIAAATAHTTQALEDTWLVAETVAGG